MEQGTFPYRVAYQLTVLLWPNKRLWLDTQILFHVWPLQKLGSLQTYYTAWYGCQAWQLSTTLADKMNVEWGKAGLLDFPGRPGLAYFLALLGMKIFIFNMKDALTIFFTQCYLAAILRSASLPLKHPSIQLVYWAEIVHFFPSSTRMVASFEISLFLYSEHSALEMHPGWSKSVSWFVRGME